MPLVTPSLKSNLAPSRRYSGCLMKRKRTTARSPVRSSSCETQRQELPHVDPRWKSCRWGGRVTHLSVETLHDCRLPHVAHVHGDLGASAEGLCVEEQYNSGFKLAADGGVHPGTDQHHPLQQPIRHQDTQTSIWRPCRLSGLISPSETGGGAITCLGGCGH